MGKVVEGFKNLNVFTKGPILSILMSVEDLFL